MSEGAQEGCAEKQGFRRTGEQGGERRNVGSSSQGIAVVRCGGASEVLPPQPVSRVSGARHSDFRMG